MAFNYFGDEWGNDGFGATKDEPVADPVPQITQQAPIGREAPKKSPIMQQTQAISEPTQSEAPQPTSSSYLHNFGDEWDTNDLTGAPMTSSIPYSSTFPDTIQQSAVPTQQPEQKEAPEEVTQVKEEEEIEAAEEPRRPAPKETRAPQPAQAERNDLNMPSTMGDWGKNKITSLGAQAPPKRRNNRRNEKPARKAPMKAAMSTQPMKAAMSTQPMKAAMGTQPMKAAMSTQPMKAAMSTQPAPAVVQAPVGPSKHQVTTEPSSVAVQDDVVQTLMEKVRTLELQVEELEKRQMHQFGGVCTLNSTGKVNNDKYIVWDSTNHIIKPQKGLNLLDDNVELQVSHRGLYQITFTTCGSNPQLVINGQVYAAARSAPTRNSVSSTSCVNIYLYLDENATIAGKVTDKIASENPCEHWLCVRLVHRGF
jgi:hypothetical protein